MTRELLSGFQEPLWAHLCPSKPLLGSSLSPDNLHTELTFVHRPSLLDSESSQGFLRQETLTTKTLWDSLPFEEKGSCEQNSVSVPLVLLRLFSSWTHPSHSDVLSLSQRTGPAVWSLLLPRACYAVIRSYFLQRDYHPLGTPVFLSLCMPSQNARPQHRERDLVYLWQPVEPGDTHFIANAG